MGRNFKLADISHTEALLKKHSTSFALVQYEKYKNYIIYVLKNRRDVDIVEETLGILLNFF